MKTLLYLCGLPGSGKATVARILEQRLGWALLWHHDLDPVFRAVKSSRVPELVNQCVEPILRHLISEDKDIIYARGSRHPATMQMLKVITGSLEIPSHPWKRPYSHRLEVIELTARYETLVKRCSQRPTSQWRINNRAGLDDYLDYLGTHPQEQGGEKIWTDNLKPEEVADLIVPMLLGKEAVVA